MSGKTPSSSHRGRRLAWAIAALAVAVLFTAGMILALDYLAKRRLLDRLAHGSNKEKVDAIKVLAERGSIRAIPELLKLTEDIEQINPRPVCSAANEAIQQIIQKRGDPAVHALATCLNQKTYERFRFFALDILQEIGPHGKAAIPVLTDFVDDKKPSIRIAAARALFEMGVEKKVFLPALLLAFHQVDPQELFFAISAVDWMEIPLPSL